MAINNSHTHTYNTVLQVSPLSWSPRWTCSGWWAGSRTWSRTSLQFHHYAPNPPLWHGEKVEDTHHHPPKTPMHHETTIFRTKKCIKHGRIVANLSEVSNYFTLFGKVPIFLITCQRISFLFNGTHRQKITYLNVSFPTPDYRRFSHVHNHFYFINTRNFNQQLYPTEAMFHPDQILYLSTSGAQSCHSCSQFVMNWWFDPGSSTNKPSQLLSFVIASFRPASSRNLILTIL